MTTARKAKPMPRLGDRQEPPQGVDRRDVAEAEREEGDPAHVEVDRRSSRPPPGVCSGEPSDHCNRAKPRISPTAQTPISTRTDSGPKTLRKWFRRFPGPHPPSQGGPGRPGVDVEQPGEPEVVGDPPGQEHRLEGVQQDQDDESQTHNRDNVGHTGSLG